MLMPEGAPTVHQLPLHLHLDVLGAVMLMPEGAPTVHQLPLHLHLDVLGADGDGW
jgi:hypothetical protein